MLYGTQLGEGFEVSPTVAVLEAVAAVEGIQPWDLKPPLYDSLDSDALDSLLSTDSVQLRLEFDYNGHTVVIESGGTVVVE